MIQTFIVSFIVSFLGSIPPGTINITTMQYSVQGHQRAALFFLLAASLTEFVYAGITVRFQLFLSESEILMDHFLIISAVAMIAIGVANLLTHTSSKKISQKIHIRGRNAFLKGVTVAILNPLTIPFWLAVTAYLQQRAWITLEGSHFWVYITGITLGTLALLYLVKVLGARYTQIADNHFLVHVIPGLTFIALGLINLYDWLV